MTVRHGLVALLAERPMGVYELRKEFDARTGGTWPLNIGQVYTTIQRLMRDGLVEHVPLEYSHGAGDAEPYRLTEPGYAEAESWWREPVNRSVPGRDELVIKLALAAASPDVDVPTVIHAQRVESMRALRDYTRLKAREPEQVTTREGLAWSLVLDNLVFTAEAEVRWLDHVEATVARVGSLPVPEVTPPRVADEAPAPVSTGDDSTWTGRGR
jgi:DNA-binding PadR family transcriptional regulator